MSTPTTNNTHKSADTIVALCSLTLIIGMVYILSQFFRKMFDYEQPYKTHDPINVLREIKIMRRQIRAMHHDIHRLRDEVEDIECRCNCDQTQNNGAQAKATETTDKTPPAPASGTTQTSGAQLPEQVPATTNTTQIHSPTSASSSPSSLIPTTDTPTQVTM